MLFNMKRLQISKCYDIQAGLYNVQWKNKLNYLPCSNSTSRELCPPALRQPVGLGHETSGMQVCLNRCMYAYSHLFEYSSKYQ